MSAVAVKLLEKCTAQGISLRPGEGFKLKVSPPPERLPKDLREELKRHKTEILTLLRQSPTWQCPTCDGPVRLEPLREEEAPSRFWTCTKCSTWGATREGASFPAVWISTQTVQ